MSRDQRWLLPPPLNELPPLDGPSCFVAEFVDILDGDTWTELGVEMERTRWERRPTVPGRCSACG